MRAFESRNSRWQFTREFLIGTPSSASRTSETPPAFSSEASSAHPFTNMRRRGSTMSVGPPDGPPGDTGKQFPNQFEFRSGNSTSPMGPRFGALLKIWMRR